MRIAPAGSTARPGGRAARGAGNESALSRTIAGTWLASLAAVAAPAPAQHARGQPRNIHAHYDLGNPFYALWLDDTWTYSAALFGGRSDLRWKRRRAKYAHICDALALQPACVLEIGCGWGGFAEHAARRGVHAWRDDLRRAACTGAARVAQAGLSDRNWNCATIAICRAPTMPSCPSRCSKPSARRTGRVFRSAQPQAAPGGQAVIQSITIANARFDAYRQSGDFIRAYIFPGGMLPSPARFAEAARRGGFSSRPSWRSAGTTPKHCALAPTLRGAYRGCPRARLRRDFRAHVAALSLLLRSRVRCGPHRRHAVSSDARALA
jgi:cyclopropane-fatty-acyl-phospholipid synthase